MTNENTHNSQPNDSATKKILLAFGRGLVYAVCMWAVFAVLYRPILSATSTATSSTSASYEKQQAEQVRVYQEQVNRANAMYTESEIQQKRMAEILSKQEELAKRLDVVMAGWERQSGVKK